MNGGGEIESAGCHKDFNYGFNCVIKKRKSCTSVVCQTNNMNLPIVSLHIPTCSLLTPLLCDVSIINAFSWIWKKWLQTFDVH